jgi:hypothetical protein
MTQMISADRMCICIQLLPGLDNKRQKSNAKQTKMFVSTGFSKPIPKHLQANQTP